MMRDEAGWRGPGIPVSNQVRRCMIKHRELGCHVVEQAGNAHKDASALVRLQEAGVELRFIPPYSPDLNPIELMGSKVKNLLRGAEARDNEGLTSEIRATHTIGFLHQFFTKHLS